jgi:PAS domain S-box-containing protein
MAEPSRKGIWLPLRFSIPLLLLTFYLVGGVVDYAHEVRGALADLERTAIRDFQRQMNGLQSNIEFLIQRGLRERVRAELVLLGTNGDIEVAALIGPDQRVQSSFRRQDMGQSREALLSQLAPTDEAPQKPGKYSASDMIGEIEVSRDRTRLIARFPVAVRPQANFSSDSPVATLVVQRSLLAAREAQQREVAHQTLQLGFIIVLFSGGLWAVLHFMISRRARRLVKAAQRISGGDFDRPIAMSGHDEFAIIAESFDNMAEQLRVQRARSEASAAQYRGVVNAAREVIWEVDATGKFTLLNPAWQAATGLSIEAGLGTSILDYLSAADDRTRNAQWAHLIADVPGGSSSTFRLVTTDGEAKWFESHSFCRRDEQGGIIAITGTWLDISHRRSSELESFEMNERLERLVEQRTHALSQSEAKMRSLVETVPEAILVVKAKGTRIVDCNQNASSLFGRDRDTLLASRLVEICPSLRIDEGGSAAATRSQWLAPSETSGGMVEWQFEHAASGEFPGEVHWTPLKDEAEPLVRLSIFDISARKAAAIALAESESRMRAIVEGAFDGIVMINLASERFTFANEAMGQLVAQPLDELVEMPVRSLHPPDRVDEVLAYFQRARMETTEKLPSVPLLRPSDDPRLADISARPLSVNGSEYVVAIYHDVTAQKRTEAEIIELNARLEQRVRDRTAALESANRELEAFSYSVSHDLRAPLRGIDGWSQLLREEYQADLGADGTTYLNRIRQEAQHMGQIIDDLLELARVNRSELSVQRVDLSALAREIQASLTAAQPQRRTVWRISSGIAAQGDPVLLKFLLQNLLENAWKFSAQPAGSEITLGQTLTGSGATFFVSDNGVGFDMAHADKLFAPFSRLHPRAQFPGTGIGLATASRIARRHGGRIWAEAEVGVGATFYFTLPDTSVTIPNSTAGISPSSS